MVGVVIPVLVVILVVDLMVGVLKVGLMLVEKGVGGRVLKSGCVVGKKKKRKGEMKK